MFGYGYSRFSVGVGSILGVIGRSIGFLHVVGATHTCIGWSWYESSSFVKYRECCPKTLFKAPDSLLPSATSSSATQSTPPTPHPGNPKSCSPYTQAYPSTTTNHPWPAPDDNLQPHNNVLVSLARFYRISESPPRTQLGRRTASAKSNALVLSLTEY